MTLYFTNVALLRVGIHLEVFCKFSTFLIVGILVLAKVEQVGLGGSLNGVFTYNSCTLWTVNFQGSALVEGSKRTVVNLAIGVAFFISGHSFPKFDRTWRQFLGISCVSMNRSYDIIKLVYPHVTAILDDMCEEEKDRIPTSQGWRFLCEYSLARWRL